MKNNGVAHRLIFLAVAGISLCAGLAAGASRLGIEWGPAGQAASLAQDHGPLMVFGFVGGAIGLERTVAVKKAWAWAGPAFHVAGVATLIGGAPRLTPAWCFAASFAVLGAIYWAIYRRQPSLAVVTQATGVIGGVGAAWLWAVTGDFATAMPLAVLYAVATVLGERMELARVTIAGAAREVRLTVAVLALAAASVVFIGAPGIGYRLMGLALVVCAALFVTADAARFLVRSTGLARYSAVCMLAGYFWLAIAGVAWLAYGLGQAHDTAVHAVFLGFVMSMIFGHAPTILAGVVRAKMPFHPVLYAPVALLHCGLVVRIFAVSGQVPGAVANIVAIILFVLTAVGLVLRGKI
ncbi:hypothetical protein CPHO_07595 [Corynebacterium phocae]|uniref:Uncharacterized protein n=1 Tax=Corynebacterium phocae TaxID=161895 RepID=A0A1L7D3U3_9CORY|nr:hypothetical protein [Corynebacterium phocae]APT92775.1 hypothetical protein CPHO_07595 [Corynebacterium phocae]KAA8723087.1 hypothetical protein F4V58_07100 [Corynebacterium phocae]